MVYNLTGLAENSTSVLGFAHGVNDLLMFGWLGTLFVLGVCVVLFMGFMWSTQSVKRSIAGTAFVGFILTLLLTAVNLMPQFALWVAIIALCASVAFLFKPE